MYNFVHFYIAFFVHSYIIINNCQECGYEADTDGTCLVQDGPDYLDQSVLEELKWTKVSPEFPASLAYGNYGYPQLDEFCSYTSDENGEEIQDCSNVTREDVVNYLNSHDLQVYNYLWLDDTFVVAEDTGELLGIVSKSSVGNRSTFSPVYYYGYYNYNDGRGSDGLRPSIILNKSQIS